MPSDLLETAKTAAVHEIDSAPLTRAEARSLGLSDARIDQLLRSERWSAPHRRVLRPNALPLDGVERVDAAVRTQPPGRAWAGLTTAARLWGLDIDELDGTDGTSGTSGTGDADHTVHLYVPRDAVTKHRPGVRLYRTEVQAADRAVLGDVPLTTPARTVVDLAWRRAYVPAVVIADAALRRGLCTKEELARTLTRLGPLRGVRAARRVIEDSDPGSDSPPETVLRLTLVAGGLPRPEANFALLDESGHLLARGDLVYRLLLIWLEYDGFAVHSTQTAFRNDRLRRRMLERRGWQVKQFSDVDLRPSANVAREVAELIAAAPARIAALPAGLSPEVDDAKAALAAGSDPATDQPAVVDQEVGRTLNRSRRHRSGVTGLQTS